LGESTVLILDKDITRKILSAPGAARKSPRFIKYYNTSLNHVLGAGLITLEGEDWKRHRHITQPAFQIKSVKEWLSNSVPSRVDRLKDYWQGNEGREIDLGSHLSALTLDIIGDIAFSHDFGALDSVRQWARNCGEEELAELEDPFMKALSLSFKPTVIGTFFFLLGLTGLERHLNPRTKQTTRHLNEAAEHVIATSTQSMLNVPKNAEQGAKQHKCLLQLLLKARENNSEKQDDKTRRALSDVDLRDEIKTFIFAGHETTSTWCYWAIYALSIFSDVQEKVYQDIINSVGKTGEINVDNVEEMEYFNAFLNEVLRMYPPVGMISRQNIREEKLGGYTIPAGTRLLFPIHLLHRHPKYWKNPDTFEPERWIRKETINGKSWADQIRFAFMPFSAGSRNCIGQRFAEIEAKLILAELIRSFSYLIAPSLQGKDITFTNFVTMKAEQGLKVCAKSR
jgi:cytochrome P450